MANAFDPASEESAPPDAGPGPSPGGPGSAPPGGGPVLAMLGRQQMGPPVTAPGPGNMAQGMQLMTQAHGLLTQALQMFPAGTPQWKDIHKSLGGLSKHMAQGPPTAGAQQTGIGDLLRNVVKNALLQKIMASRSQSVGGGGGGGGQPGGEPESGVPGIPSPATPLPGA